MPREELRISAKPLPRNLRASLRVRARLGSATPPAAGLAAPRRRPRPGAAGAAFPGCRAWPGSWPVARFRADPRVRDRQPGLR